MAESVYGAGAPQAQTEDTDSEAETKPASKRSFAVRAGEIADKILELRCFIECVWMAAEAIDDPPQTHALQIVLEHVLNETRDLAERVAPSSVRRFEPPEDDGEIAVLAKDAPQMK